MTKAHYARIAQIYDDFVKTEVDVQFFISEAQQAGGNILELMVGTGRLTIPLLKAGIQVTCVDYSAEMLAQLETKLHNAGLSAEIYRMDIRALSLPRQYKQIIIPFQAFPEITNEDDQIRALERIHAHLTDDGTFICTFHNPKVRLRIVDGSLRLAGRFQTQDTQLFVWLQQAYNPATKLVNVLEFFEEYNADGIMIRKLFSELQFYIMEHDTFAAQIERVGFEVVALYGDYAYSPFDPDSSPVMVWVLRKA